MCLFHLNVKYISFQARTWSWTSFLFFRHSLFYWNILWHLCSAPKALANYPQSMMWRYFTVYPFSLISVFYIWFVICTLSPILFFYINLQRHDMEPFYHLNYFLYNSLQKFLYEMSLTQGRGWTPLLATWWPLGGPGWVGLMLAVSALVITARHWVNPGLV